ncbi:DNA excision repair protein [Venturia nashicola]|uniref:DNA excision repair protein n=1 Tax=Venturia nashicola TaxID=86259 RepID=A0A4Z1PEL6_9PEZI|nr:DNA excision repair protein [Venturia nashicola]TLD30296.1 DNA excision repair protein [Venturia nashicola]
MSRAIQPRTKTYTHNKYEPGRETIVEKVNGMEGDDISDSDLDILHVISKEVEGGNTDTFIRGVIGSQASETDNESSDTAHSDDDEVVKKDKVKKRVYSVPSDAEKVHLFSDEDSETAYTTFKNRKAKKRKRAAAETKRHKAQKASKTSTIVGKRALPPAAKKDEKKRPKWGEEAVDNELNHQLDDEHVPDYIKNRKEKFEKIKEKLGEAGLKLPPSYGDVYFSDDEILEDIKEKPQLPRLTPCAPYEDKQLQYSGGTVPAPIAQWLRDYQVEGAEFLHELFVWQRGGILGDDMGLGKTIQVISFLTAAFGKTGDARDRKRMRKMRRKDDNRWYPKVLIVCPSGLIENWKAELDRWGWWTVYVYHGTVSDKDEALRAATTGRLEIMIVPYATYRINASAINTIDWDCVVADECHQIKGRQSETTHAMNDINALCRIGLTGTAIQNNYDELWTLLNWTNPGRFGSLASWQASISKPLKIGQAHDASSYELGLARRTAEKLVKNLLPQFFLRRMKSLIAHQLPKKSDRVVFCPLTETQAEAYANYIDSEILDYIRSSAEMCPCSSGKKRGWCCYAYIPGHGKWQHYVFPAIVTLQKLANHLAQLIPSGQDDQEKQNKDLQNLQIALPDAWKDLWRDRDSIINFANQEFCGKWKILKKLLQFWHQSGDKVLIFSHSVRLLKMLQILFTSTTTYNVSYLDGSLQLAERARVVDDFNASPAQFVFLISTKAGGVGLNITSANKVVVVDPNWNPSYDLQAQDRAYRIGQLRDVEVFRLVSAGTIEEIVYARQIYKQQQANIGYTASSERRYFKGVQDDKGKKGEIFGLANLFAYQGEGVVLQEIVNKTNVAESKLGVMVAGVDMSQNNADDDDPFKEEEGETAAMSQLAAIIENGGEEKPKQRRKVTPKIKTDPIMAILSNAGVEYTHENSEVIGTSKTEAKLSRRAAENINTIEGNDMPIFSTQDQGDMELEEGGIQWRFRPPELVRKRQFCEMARTFGFSDATEFALVVEGWTQEERRECLDKFYARRRVQLLGEAAKANKAEMKADRIHSTAIAMSARPAPVTESKADANDEEKEDEEESSDEL